jgi:hypothetical protein
VVIENSLVVVLNCVTLLTAPEVRFSPILALEEDSKNPSNHVKNALGARDGFPPVAEEASDFGHDLQGW